MVMASLTTPSDLLRLQTVVVPSSLRRGQMQSTEGRLSSLRRRSSRKKARLMLILTTVLLRVLPTARLKRNTSIKRSTSASLQFAAAISLVYTRSIIDYNNFILATHAVIIKALRLS